MQLLVIDNYDSFTYNLVHLLEQLNADMKVVRNDALNDDLSSWATHVLISPGPGLPSEAGKLMDFVRQISIEKPVLGVCLGMQCLLEMDGATMKNLEVVAHGAQDQIHILGGALFSGLPPKFAVGRYHSWGFRMEDVPAGYVVTSMSDDAYVMSVQHLEHPWHGVQFHPESIMTEHGLAMLRNWLVS